MPDLPDIDQQGDVLTESETGPGVISHKAVAAVSDKTAAALNLVASVST